MKTPILKASEIERKWYVVDAEGQTLGRLASQVSRILKGKHKAEYSPFQDVGDHVIIINAEKIQVTGRKAEQKVYRHHSTYPGGLKEVPWKDMMAKHPERILERAIKGMLPKNSLGRQMYRKLKVYAGSEHPHAAQKPEILEF
ncbi:MAG: 50S ribosomal protein L13 [Eubacteriales bacterium]|nr:50S ribosomal protein L13 [Eubacteriales bacterium]